LKETINKTGVTNRIPSSMTNDFQFKVIFLQTHWLLLHVVCAPGMRDLFAEYLQRRVMPYIFSRPY